MKKKLALLLIMSIAVFFIAIPVVAHAGEEANTIPAGNYTVELPGGGTLGFTVAADGTVTVTVLPDGAALTSGPTATDEGFKVTLTNGTASNVFEVSVESEDGQITVKAEQDVEDNNDQQDVSGDNNQGDNVSGDEGDGQDVESPEPTPTETESPEATASPEPSDSPDSGSSTDSGSGGSTDSGSGGGTD